jgi:Family of unknown function (DUF6788)
MSKALNKLLKKRKALHIKLENIGDLRRGTISVNYRKCGKKNCICAKDRHPGHGPKYLWSTTIKGKSYSKNLKLGAEMQKYKEEIANYPVFLKLSDEIIKINEEICDLRPIPEVRDKNELETLKKKLQNLYMKKYKERLTV